MKIFITGGSGFIGGRLTAVLSAAGHDVCVLSRSERARGLFPQEVAVVSGDPVRPGPWQEEAAGSDVLINLAGLSIFRRWNSVVKREIRESRILTTRNLVDAVAGKGSGGPVFFSASAVGYYGFHGDEELTENSPPGRDFLARVAEDWEDEAFRAAENASRVVITRFGVVLGRGGGALSKLVPIFKGFLGGPLGGGRQWMSWIHIKDLTDAFLFILDHPEVEGPVNFTTPYPMRNRDFAIALGRELKRPSVMPVPGAALRLAVGEMAETLLNGQRVTPGVLKNSGFQFSFPHLDKALEDLLRPKKSG